MCKRTMHKRARIPMFLWERRACANSGAQAVFPRPRKNGLGTRLGETVKGRGRARARRPRRTDGRDESGAESGSGYGTGRRGVQTRVQTMPLN